eukprot:4334823-Pyramimonas_sp.AAC.1
MKNAHVEISPHLDAYLFPMFVMVLTWRMVRRKLGRYCSASQGFIRESDKTEKRGEKQRLSDGQYESLNRLEHACYREDASTSEILI